MRAALTYAGRGWHVFPCHSPSEAPGGCSCWRAGCSSPAKHPRVAGGLNSATTDPALIERWWQRWPTANVAVRTGAVSGIIVVDVDPAHGGDASLSALLAKHGPVPPGATVQTGAGGRHLYFAHPGGIVRNDTGRRLGPGLDVRGDGGYVIAPPSAHASGDRYRWDSADRSLPEAPAWLLGPLREPARTAVPVAETSACPTRRLSAWARAALERELGRVGAAAEGARNDTLNRAAFSLGQIVSGGALDAGDVETLLLDRARAVGLGEREARATIASGLAAGANQPRGPAATTIDLRAIPLRDTPTATTSRAAQPKVPSVDLPAPR